jgi:hypothetical protein
MVGERIEEGFPALTLESEGWEESRRFSSPRRG